MSEHLTEEERWAKRAEAERRFAPNGEANKWRKGIFGNKLIDVYFNPDLIKFIFTQRIAQALPKTGYCRIADFCSGTGHVGRRVAKQLTKPSRRVHPTGFDDFIETFWIYGKPSVCIPTHKCSLPELDYSANTFDAGILRFAMPFIRNDLQPQAIKRMFRVMKPGGVLVVLNDGAIDAKTARVAYERFIEGLVAGGKTEESARSWLYTSSYEELKGMGEAAGFVVGPAKDLTDTVINYISPESMAQSRGLDDEQKARLLAVYARSKKEHPTHFEPDPNSLRMPWRMHTFTLTKPVREPV